jgi:DNA replication protein DnaC
LVGLVRGRLSGLLGCGANIQEHHSIAITGMTGTGKTYVACALAHAACRKGYRALYRRAPRLFDEFMLAHADGAYPRLLARLAKIDVLVIDDWGFSAPTDQERRDLLEILEDRTRSCRNAGYPSYTQETVLKVTLQQDGVLQDVKYVRYFSAAPPAPPH